MSEPLKPKVLAVDDRAENLTALAAGLGTLAVEVVPADSGPAALRALLNEDFALILLDVDMPGMDGFETAEHIRRRPRTRHIPIVFLTAQAYGPSQLFRAFGQAPGTADVLYKPFDPWLLRTKVGVFLDLHRKNLEVARLAETVQRLGVRISPP